MEYPRTVKLENEKLRNLLEEKEGLVIMGQDLTADIETKEAELKKIDEEIQVKEKEVDISDLLEKAKLITEEFNAVVAKMEAHKKTTFERIKAQVPAELYTQYTDTEKAKKKIEEDRNKIGLKIQQKKDKIIPLTRKLMKSHIQNEYEDYDSIRIENGEIVSTIFNHLEDFKLRFASRKKTN